MDKEYLASVDAGTFSASMLKFLCDSVMRWPMPLEVSSSRITFGKDLHKAVLENGKGFHVHKRVFKEKYPNIENVEKRYIKEWEGCVTLSGKVDFTIADGLYDIKSMLYTTDGYIQNSIKKFRYGLQMAVYKHITGLDKVYLVCTKGHKNYKDFLNSKPKREMFKVYEISDDIIAEGRRQIWEAVRLILSASIKPEDFKDKSIINKLNFYYTNIDYQNML